MDNNNALSALVKASVATGLASGAAVVVGWMLTSNVKPNYISAWQTVGLSGAIGAILGAQWGVNGGPWFNENSWHFRGL
jgi:hypothetical protein